MATNEFVYHRGTEAQRNGMSGMAAERFHHKGAKESVNGMGNL